MLEHDPEDGPRGTLTYVRDLWFERVVKGRLRGEARLVRYIRLCNLFPISIEGHSRT